MAKGPQERRQVTTAGPVWADLMGSHLIFRWCKAGSNATTLILYA